jgi:radical SAM-linked protein
MVRNRVRIRFTKQGDLRWIGHRDLMRCWERLFRRAELPLRFSEGFHPKARMTFPLALAVGVSTLDEVMEVELAEPRPAEQVQSRLASLAPQGMSIRSVESLPADAKKVEARAVCYEGRVPANLDGFLPDRIRVLLDAKAWPVEREGKSPVDVRPFIQDLSYRGGVLAVRLSVDRGRCPGPRELLAALGLSPAEQQAIELCRTAVEVN